MGFETIRRWKKISVRGSENCQTMIGVYQEVIYRVTINAVLKRSGGKGVFLPAEKMDFFYEKRPKFSYETKDP